MTVCVNKHTALSKQAGFLFSRFLDSSGTYLVRLPGDLAVSLKGSTGSRDLSLGMSHYHSVSEVLFCLFSMLETEAG